MAREDDLMREGYMKAIEVMRKNVTSMGFSASPERHSNYYSVWARDHSICSLAACLTGKPDLIKTAKRGIMHLLRYQIDHGQVPSYIEIEGGKRVYGGLGSITSIDSNMWVAIAAAYLYKNTGHRKLVQANYVDKYKRFYRLFKAFDSNDCGLIEVHRAGDWADIFNRTYHVLYDEALYYQSLKALQYLFREAGEKSFGTETTKEIRKRVRWIAKRKPYVKRKINENFWLTRENTKAIKEEYMIHDRLYPREYPYYQSHLVPFRLNWQRRFESFGNSLAMAFNIASKERKRAIIMHAKNTRANEPFPIRALDPPVRPGDKDWYPIYRKRERPYTYHNGAIWPVISGFWIHALSKNRFKKTARKDMIRLAKALKEQDWRFHEYMHGKTGEPMGRSEQAWSAAGYIIAYHSLKSKVNLFDY